MALNVPRKEKRIYQFNFRLTESQAIILETLAKAYRTSNAGIMRALLEGAGLEEVEKLKGKFAEMGVDHMVPRIEGVLARLHPELRKAEPEATELEESDDEVKDIDPAPTKQAEEHFGSK